MKFWLSGELDHRIADAFPTIRSRVESRLNAQCEERDYGDAVTEIAIIPMILGPEFLQGKSERRLWQRKQRAADYRTFIDFETFRGANDTQRERLLVMNTVNAVLHLQRKVGKQFRGVDLVADILAEFGLVPEDVLSD